MRSWVADFFHLPVFPRLTPVVAGHDSIQYSIPLLLSDILLYGWYLVDFIRSQVEEHMDYLFPFLAIMNNAAINNYIQVLVWMYAFISLGYFSRSGIAWSYGNCVANHLNNCQTVCWNIISHFTSLPAMCKGPNNYNIYYCLFWPEPS